MNIKKRVFKTLLITFGSIIVIILLFLLLLKYEISWKISNVGREVSPDGRYSVLFQSVGEADWPFGYSHAKVTVYDGKKKIKSFREDIADDGAAFREDNYSVSWMLYGLVITFKGSEQGDREEEIFYDGRDSFKGYSEDEIESVLKERYDFKNIEQITKKNNEYDIRADGINFSADTTLSLHDSYKQELFKATTEELCPGKIQRSVSWDVSEGIDPSKLIYTPIFSMNNYGTQDLEAFCRDMCRWLEDCFKELPYDEGKDIYDSTGIIVETPEYGQVEFDFRSMTDLERFTDDSTEFYNELYHCISHFINEKYNAEMKKYDTDEISEGTVVDDENMLDITDDAIKQWASYEPEMVWDFSDEIEYALTAVDRALGSSFYVLLSFDKKGNKDSAELVNGDPFCGECGEAAFMKFLDDGKTGFIALSYNGGCDGLLYETFDGGLKFHFVELPLPDISLLDGKKYNPFVLPEDVWEESGKIYLKMKQGIDGDYHGKELDGARAAGIYESVDGGKTFEFLREEAE